MSAVVNSLHFPFRFDLALLRADLALAKTLAWHPHYNEKEYGGQWAAIALRSTTGENGQIVPGLMGGGRFCDTPLLAQCPYFRQVLAFFECPLKSVRLLSLAPGSFIREHCDSGLSYDDGEIRLHVPVQTNPDVEFYLAGERLLLEEGHCYFVNVNLPHRVNNRGDAERIHLVIDAEVNEWVRALFWRGVEEGWAITRSPAPPKNVDDFRRHVLRQPALQKELQAIENPKFFERKAKDLAAELGFDFHEGDIDAAFRCGPLLAHEPASLAAGWTPVRAFVREQQPMAEWLYTGAKKFTEPFFEQSVRAALRLPFARLFRRQAPLRLALSIPDRESLAPAGFIFHMSRCGSTLVSQMLAALPQSLLLSEPGPVDEMIQLNNVEWLRWIVKALGRKRSGEETHFFVKLDAWHIRNFALIRTAFPNTPWVFLCREPLEVMVSHLAKPGKFSIPAEVELSREEHCARVLNGILSAAVEAVQSDAGGLIVDYRDLPESVFGRIAGHFGVRFSDAETALMRKVAAFNAKTPALFFEPDVELKRSAASLRVKELCTEYLDDLYNDLTTKKVAAHG